MAVAGVESGAAEKAGSGVGDSDVPGDGVGLRLNDASAGMLDSVGHGIVPAD